MKMRNRLLEERPNDAAWLSSVEAQMASLGVAMTLARSEMIGLLPGSATRARATPFRKRG